MSDIVVTIPKNFRFNGLTGLAAWISEGDPAGAPWSGSRWIYSIGRGMPKINPGERAYVVYDTHLIGYAPLLECRRSSWNDGCELVRGGGAVAITIAETIPGFRGFRYRWWDRSIEVPFPEWRQLAKMHLPHKSPLFQEAIKS